MATDVRLRSVSLKLRPTDTKQVSDLTSNIVGNRNTDWPFAGNPAWTDPDALLIVGFRYQPKPPLAPNSQSWARHAGKTASVTPIPRKARHLKKADLIGSLLAAVFSDPEGKPQRGIETA